MATNAATSPIDFDPFDIRLDAPTHALPPLEAALQNLVIESVSIVSASVFFLESAPIPDIEGGDDDDLLTGGGGGDLIAGRAGDDILIGNGGDDELLGGNGADVLIGGDGDDELDGGNGVDNLLGGDGADRLNGSNGDDVLSGELGDDVIVGGAGDDRARGGSGADRLNGETGDDILNGGAGDDILTGGEGVDRLFGGDGQDTFAFVRIGMELFGDAVGQVASSQTEIILDFDPSADRLDFTATEMTSFDQFLAAARDTSFGMQVFFGGEDVLKIKGVSVADIAAENLLLAEPPIVDPDATLTLSFNGPPTTAGGNDADVLRAGIFGDHLAGVAGDDTLIGGDADDNLEGGAGDDRLVGGDGEDFLNAGQGDDILTGGAGADLFNFSLGQSGVDVVRDFDVGEDLLKITRFGGPFTELDDLLAAARDTTFGMQIALGDGDFIKLIGVSVDELNDTNVLLSGSP